MKTKQCHKHETEPKKKKTHKTKKQKNTEECIHVPERYGGVI